MDAILTTITHFPALFYLQTAQYCLDSVVVGPPCIELVSYSTGPLNESSHDRFRVVQASGTLNVAYGSHFEIDVRRSPG